MIGRQTVQPDKVLILSEKSPLPAIDITWRYRTGYEKLKHFDVILFMENDDWYHPQYIEMMINKWHEQGQPDLLGTSYTIYYHIGVLAHFTMQHRERASQMNTLIRGGLDLKWCSDSEPYTDMWLWMRTDINKIRRVIFTPDKTYSIGIKHGVGLCGGSNHFNRMHRYTNQDENMKFLKSLMDIDSLNFYSKLHYELSSKVTIA